MSSPGGHGASVVRWADGRPRGRTPPTSTAPRLPGATFENPTGGRGAGGSPTAAARARRAAGSAPASASCSPTSTGPGTIRHIWMTFPPAPPEQHAGHGARGLLRRRRPSRASRCRASTSSGCPTVGRSPTHSALTAAQRGPRLQQLRARCRSGGACASSSSTARTRPRSLYYQVDYTLEPELRRRARLPARRVPPREPDRACSATSSSPTACAGPGRFLGCVVGVRVIDEGDVVRRGRGEGVPRRRRRAARRSAAPASRTTSAARGAWARTPRRTAARRSSSDPAAGPARWPATPTSSASTAGTCPTRSCSRRDLRVTIQQIGAAFFRAGQEAELAAYEQHQPAGRRRLACATSAPGLLAWGIAERVDDYCATSFVYCREPQPVPRVDVAAALADIEPPPLRGGVAVRAAGRNLASVEQPGA